jgi:hypothetical protein
MRSALQLAAGALVATGLMLLAVVLWSRQMIYFAAPVGVASVAAVWVVVDNVFIYGRRRQPDEETGMEGSGDPTAH